MLAGLRRAALLCLAAALLGQTAGAGNTTTVSTATAALNASTATPTTGPAAMPSTTALPCNPTSCLHGLTCHDQPGFCGPYNQPFTCHRNFNFYDYSNRKSCPAGTFRCADGFCPFNPTVCESHGGLVQASELCTDPGESIVCQIPHLSACNMSASFCQRVTLPACVDFGSFRVYVDPGADLASMYWDNACVGFPAFVAGATAPVAGGVCSAFSGLETADGAYKMPVEAQFDIRVVAPGTPCPDCRLRPYAVDTASCQTLRTADACRSRPDSCVWTGLPQVACATTADYLAIVSSEATCFSQAFSEAECDRLIQCAWAPATQSCESPPSVDANGYDNRTAAAILGKRFQLFFNNPLFLTFDREHLIDTPDGLAVRDLSEKGHHAVMDQFNECNLAPGVHGSGAAYFDRWERLRVLNMAAVPEQFAVGFFALATAEHEVDALDDLAGGFSGQRFILGTDAPSPDNTTGYLCISIGTNGISVYSYSSAAGTFAPLLVYEAELLGWHSFVVTVLSNRPTLYVDANKVAEGRAYNTVAMKLDWIGWLEWGQFSGGIDYLYPLDARLFTSWGDPELFRSLATSLETVRLDLECILTYPDQTVTAGADYASEPPTIGFQLREDAGGATFAYDLQYEGSDALAINASTGVISGRFRARTAVQFEVIVIENDGPCQTSFLGRIDVLPRVRATLDPASVQAVATVDAFYEPRLAYTVTGGDGRYAFADASPAPVPGLGVNPATGAVAGVPEAAGNFTVAVRVMDGLGGSATVQYGLRVSERLSLGGRLEEVTANARVALQPPVVQGGTRSATQPYTYQQKGPLPEGLRLDNRTGVVEGFPVLPADASAPQVVLVSVIDNSGAEITVATELVISPELVAALTTADGRPVRGPLAALTLPINQEVSDGTPLAGLRVTVAGGTRQAEFQFSQPPGLALAVRPAAAAARQRRAAGAPVAYELVGAVSQATLGYRGPLVLNVSDQGGSWKNVTLVAALEVVAEGSGDSGSALVAIIGGVAGALLCLLAGLLVWKMRRDQQRHNRPFDFKGLKVMLPGDRPLVFPKELRESRFTMWATIGEGFFGSVTKAINGADQSIVAIKRAKEDDPVTRDAVLKEALLHAQLVHPNIVSLIGVVTRHSKAWMVLEYCEKGSLLELISSQTLSTELFLGYALDVASGMKYLEENSIVHCDLAARNILLTNDFRCKVCDLGLAHNMQEDSEYYRGAITDQIPFRWAAPEVIVQRKYSCASDVWSFGVTLHEMLNFGQKPYGSWKCQQILQELRKGFRLRTPEGTARDIGELLIRCWQWDPARRATFAETHLALVHAAEARHITILRRASGRLKAPVAISKISRAPGTGSTRRSFRQLFQKDTPEAGNGPEQTGPYSSVRDSGFALSPLAFASCESASRSVSSTDQPKKEHHPDYLGPFDVNAGAPSSRCDSPDAHEAGAEAVDHDGRLQPAPTNYLVPLDQDMFCTAESEVYHRKAATMSLV